MSAISSIAITILGITIALSLIGWIGALANLPKDIAPEIQSAIHWLFSVLYTFDWLIALESALQILLVLLSLKLVFYATDAVIALWKMIKRWHS